MHAAKPLHRAPWAGQRDPVMNPVGGSMKQRRLEAETMDDPALDAAEHVHALRGLSRLNRISGSARALWRSMADLVRTPGQTLRVLDLATGGGDVPIMLHRLGRRAGVNLQIEGCDCSGVALDHARRAAERADAPIRFFHLDALSDPIPAGYDVITSSLFLHHLTDEQALRMLEKMAAAAGRRVIVNDLQRSRISLITVWAGARLLTRSSVVHVDGPRSVRAAFTIKEARDLARRAGLTDADVQRHGPWRWVLIWNR